MQPSMTVSLNINKLQSDVQLAAAMSKKFPKYLASYEKSWVMI